MTYDRPDTCRAHDRGSQSRAPALRQLMFISDSALLRRNGYVRRPFQPLFLSILLQEKDHAVPGRGFSGFFGRKSDSAADQRFERFDVDFRAAKKSELHVEPAGVPEFRTGAD